MADPELPAEWVDTLARELAAPRWNLFDDDLREEYRALARAGLAALLAIDALVTPPGQRRLRVDGLPARPPQALSAGL